MPVLCKRLFHNIGKTTEGSNVYHQQEEEPAREKNKGNSIAAVVPMRQPACCPMYLFSHAQLTPSLCWLPTKRMQMWGVGYP